MLADISVNQNLCEGKIAMSAYSDLYLSDTMRNLGGMLEYAVNDARERKMSGICTLVSRKKKPFIGDRKFFEYFGFREVDSIDDP